MFLFFGNDEFQVEESARKKVDALVPPGDGMLGVDIIDGRVDNVEGALSALSSCRAALLTLGFFSKDKVVWFRHVNFLGAEGEISRSSRVKEQVQVLADMIEKGLPDGVSLVISAGGLDRRQRFFKVCDAAGEAVLYALPEKSYQVEASMRSRAGEWFKKAGIRVPEAAMQAFLDRVGVESRQIAGEIEKLDLYLGKRRELTAEDVQQVVSSSRTAMIWDIADAVTSRDLDVALGMVRQLLFQGESAIGLVVILSTRFRELILFRDALDRGWMLVRPRGRQVQVEWGNPPADMEALFETMPTLDPRKMNPYRAGLLAEQAGRFRVAELTRWRQVLYETHMKLVSGRMPADILLDVMLLRLVGGQKPAEMRK